jgi:hypothetical protein
MFIERDEEDIYEGYKMPNVILSEEDIGVIRKTIDNKNNLSPRNREILQIDHIASCCGIEVTNIEKLLYRVLRKKMSPLAHEEQTSILTWTLSDQALVREVILITEGKGERYQSLTDTYPNIF